MPSNVSNERGGFRDESSIDGKNRLGPKRPPPHAVTAVVLQQLWNKSCFWRLRRGSVLETAPRTRLEVFRRQRVFPSSRRHQHVRKPTYSYSSTSGSYTYCSRGMKPETGKGPRALLTITRSEFEARSKHCCYRYPVTYACTGRSSNPSGGRHPNVPCRRRSLPSNEAAYLPKGREEHD